MWHKWLWEQYFERLSLLFWVFNFSSFLSKIFELFFEVILDLILSINTLWFQFIISFCFPIMVLQPELKQELINNGSVFIFFIFHPFFLRLSHDPVHLDQSSGSQLFLSSFMVSYNGDRSFLLIFDCFLQSYSFFLIVFEIQFGIFPFSFNLFAMILSISDR